MARNSRLTSGLPPAAKERLVQLGSRIRLARQRRMLTLAQLASQSLATINTLRGVEAGDPGVSIAAYIAALWALGLDATLDEVAQVDGAGLAAEAGNRRVRRPKADRDDAF